MKKVDGVDLADSAVVEGRVVVERDLGTMGDGATKQGDDQPWTPTITVKGGASGFYRIKVGK